jgi:hypothetical protein
MVLFLVFTNLKLQDVSQSKWGRVLVPIVVTPLLHPQPPQPVSFSMMQYEDMFFSAKIYIGKFLRYFA